MMFNLLGWGQNMIECLNLILIHKVIHKYDNFKKYFCIILGCYLPLPLMGGGGWSRRTWRQLNSSSLSSVWRQRYCSCLFVLVLLYGEFVLVCRRIGRIRKELPMQWSAWRGWRRRTWRQHSVLFYGQIVLVYRRIGRGWNQLPAPGVGGDAGFAARETAAHQNHSCTAGVYC